MATTRIVVMALVLALAGAGGALLSGCDENDGPAEQAGERIDEAVDDFEDAVD